MTTVAPPPKEEHSMDQCRSRLKLSENFERHWSIPISGEIHMDQSLVHTFSWGNSYGPWTNAPESSSKVSPYTGIGPWMAIPRFREQKRHIKLSHIELFPVALVTGPPGRVFGQKDLCSLGSEDSTQSFDPWPPGRETPRSPEWSPAKKIYVYVPFSFLSTICHENITQLIRKTSNQVTVIKNNSAMTGVLGG